MKNRMCRAYKVCLCVMLLLAGKGFAAEQVVNIAVAANFAGPVKHFASAFEEKTGIRPVITVGSSGTLFAQIGHGAPFDIFLSADAARPEALVAEGKADKQNLRSYARGRLALVTRQSAPSGLEEFLTRQFNKPVAIANPKLAPYGLAAEQVLSTLPENTAFPFKLVRGKSILQAWQYFTAGNVDDAFVAWSLVKNSKANYWLIPASMHDPIVQKMVIVKHNQHPYAARRFMQYMMSPAVQNALADWGYQPVKARQKKNKDKTGER